ncbi:hypothetical protein TUM19329_14930 [Legionella antarctica]|uniref:Uncharacterized protein n=1 Tax=Legionella antarctica TaxID=2708020 RepID=A0A6F8T528_9GAMM|nr:hypothetical protein TUM19329_14930 [Legionella antarctica]
MKLPTTIKHAALPDLMYLISVLENQDEALNFFTDLCAHDMDLNEAKLTLKEQKIEVRL